MQITLAKMLFGLYVNGKTKKGDKGTRGERKKGRANAIKSIVM